MESSFGFHVPDSETSHKTRLHSAPSRPLLSSTQHGSVIPTWSDENHLPGASGRKFNSRDHPLPSSRFSSYEQTVRKVHRTSSGAGGGEGGRGSSGVTNSASWRIGRKIAEEVLRENREKEAEKEDEVKEKRTLGRGKSPPSASSLLLSSPGSTKPEDRDSLPANLPSSSTDHGSNATSGHTQGHAHSSQHDVDRGGAPDGITASSSSSSILDATAEKLSLDMKQLMDELNSPPAARVYGGSRSAAGQQSGGGLGRGKRETAAKPWRENMKERGGATSGDHPASKKPKLSAGDDSVLCVVDATYISM